MGKPAWKSVFAGKRLKAVRELDDQDILLEIVQTDLDKAVVEAALARLEDQALLEQLVLDEQIPGVFRERALLKIVDQAFLGRIAAEGPPHFKRIAYRNLTDEATLLEIVGSLDDRYALSACTENCPSEKVKLRVAEKIRFDRAGAESDTMRRLITDDVRTLVDRFESFESLVRLRAMDVDEDLAFWAEKAIGNAIQNEGLNFLAIPEPTRSIVKSKGRVDDADLCPGSLDGSLWHEYVSEGFGYLDHGYSDDDDMKAAKTSKVQSFTCKNCGHKETTFER